jgi:hypothetical protein
MFRDYPSLVRPRPLLEDILDDWKRGEDIRPASIKRQLGERFRCLLLRQPTVPNMSSLRPASAWHLPLVKRRSSAILPVSHVLHRRPCHLVVPEWHPRQLCRKYLHSSQISCIGKGRKCWANRLPGGPLSRRGQTSSLPKES